MSDFQQKDGTGVLFKNERKTKDGQPDYQGSLTVNGKQVQLGGWLNTAKSGKKYMSLSVSDYVRKDRAENAVTQTGGNDDPDDSLPF